MSLRPLYTPEDLANAARISAGYVRKQARLRCIEAVKIAGAWRFTEAQYNAFIQAYTVSAAPARETNSGRTARATTPEVVQLHARPPRRRRGA